MNQAASANQSQPSSVATTTTNQSSSRSTATPTHPPASTTGAGQTPHQPVEFNHAISYVNKIKVYTYMCTYIHVLNKVCSI